LIRGPVPPIALVGIGCRFPGARGPRELWQLLREGRNAVREVPEHRAELGFNIDEVYDPRPGVPGRISSRRAGFLDHLELFDPQAFGLSPRDAVGMEPQQRLACEVVWDALEDAGIPVESLQGERVAVMFGHMAEDYSREQIAVLGEDRFRRNIDVWAAGGISRAVLSGRISFLLGVQGPSFTVDTACSSSLLTVHLACQSLWSGEARLAIAGGVNAFLTPEGMIALSRVGMLSPDGCCKAFDDGANGFVRAEGAGAVVLRPLGDALAARDPIYALIRGSGFSADGRDGGHMMAPGRAGQAQAMRDAYARAAISPAEVHFVEAHGTGTVIGDPVEVGALADVMGPGRAPERPLWISSIKGNIGHCESASGVAGLIRAALSVFHRELPAQLHFRTPSRAIPWDRVPIRVPRELGSWPYPERALAGVNSFGISGTNAHVVLEQAPERDAPARESASREERPLLVPLSAHSEAALAELASALGEQAAREAAKPQPALLRDLAFTLARRRSQRAQRVAVVARTQAELAAEFERLAAGTSSPTTRRGVASPGRSPGVVFAFSGHGTHWPGMGRALLSREPVFRSAIEEWDREQRKHLDWSLFELIDQSVGGERLERIDVMQPALSGIAIALTRLWQHWGVRPCAVLGHSGGEIAAAYAAGCIDLRDAARIACARGSVVRELAPPGAMALVALPADALAAELAAQGGRVSVAGANSPSLTIVSGDCDAIEGLVEQLARRGVFARRLRVEFASHGPHMDALAPELARRLAGIRPRAGRVPFHSTVCAAPLEGSALDAAYWGRNLRAPVRFAETAAALIAGGAEHFLEIAPHPVLGLAIEEIARASEKRVSVASSLRRDADDRLELLASLGGLFAQGCAVDFAALYPEGRVVATPLYPYQRSEYWFGAKRGREGRRAAHPFVGLAGANATALESSQEQGRSFWQIDLARDALGSEPRSGAAVPVPLANLAASALVLGARSWPGAPLALRELELAQPLLLPESGLRTLQLACERRGEGLQLCFASRAAGGQEPWRAHLRARVAPVAAPEQGSAPERDALCAEAAEPESCGAFYAALERAALPCPRERRVLGDVRCAKGRATARIARAALPAPPQHGGIDAALLDACLHLAIRAAQVETGEAAGWQVAAAGALLALPFAGDAELVAQVSLCEAEAEAGARALAGEARLARSDGTPVAVWSGLRVERRAEPVESTGPWLYAPVWRPLQLPAAETPPPRTLVLGADAPIGERELAAALQRAGAAGAARILVVTRAAEQVARGEAPGASPRFPLRPSAVLELAARHPELAIHCVDVSAELPAPERELLAQLCGCGPLEPELAIRGSALFARRLVSAPQSSGPPRRIRAAGRSFAAQLSDPTRLAGAALREIRRRPPGPGEIEIEVRAAGLCFLDVLKTLGLEREPDSGALGLECAGVVSAVGEGVREHAVGDAVLGFARGAIATHAVTPAALAVALPAQLDFAQAAAFPLARSVAEHALCGIARLREGERVVVHSAAGALGLAAVALAVELGAEVIASAGSERKRAWLRDCGAALALDSRAADLAAQVERHTRGRGADLLLDLAGDAELLALLAPGGRCVAIERSGAPGRAPARRSAQPRNLSLHALDPVGLLEAKPEELAAALRSAVARAAAGAPRREPITAFPIAQLARALRFMAQARHLGKVIVQLDAASDAQIEPLAAPAGLAAGAVLVAGAPARDPALLRWLLAREPRQILWLSSEADVPQESLRRQLGSLDASRTALQWIQGSASSPAAIRAVCARLEAPLRAIAFVSDPDAQRAEEQVGSARALLELARERDVDLCWVASRFESPASRESLALAALAREARAAGTPAVAVASARGEHEACAAQNFAPQERIAAGAAAEYLLHPIAPGAWDAGADPFLGELGAGAAAALGPAALARLPVAERRAKLRELTGLALAAVLQLGPAERERIDWQRPLSELGLDSLMGVELGLRLREATGIEIQPAALFGGPDLEAVVAQLAGAAAALGEELR